MAEVAFFGQRGFSADDPLVSPDARVRASVGAGNDCEPYADFGYYIAPPGVVLPACSTVDTVLSWARRDPRNNQIAQEILDLVYTGPGRNDYSGFAALEELHRFVLQENAKLPVPPPPIAKYNPYPDDPYFEGLECNQYELAATNLGAYFAFFAGTPSVQGLDPEYERFLRKRYERLKAGCPVQQQQYNATELAFFQEQARRIAAGIPIITFDTAPVVQQWLTQQESGSAPVVATPGVVNSARDIETLGIRRASLTPDEVAASDASANVVPSEPPMMGLAVVLVAAVGLFLALKG